MGGWQSAYPNPDVKEKSYYDVRKERNNNKEDVIVIPVDLSKHADDAFECGYSLYCISVVFTTCARWSIQLAEISFINQLCWGLVIVLNTLVICSIALESVC